MLNWNCMGVFGSIRPREGLGRSLACDRSSNRLQKRGDSNNSKSISFLRSFLLQSQSAIFSRLQSCLVGSSSSSNCRVVCSISFPLSIDLASCFLGL